MCQIGGRVRGQLVELRVGDRCECESRDTVDVDVVAEPS